MVYATPQGIHTKISAVSWLGVLTKKLWKKYGICFSKPEQIHSALMRSAHNSRQTRHEVTAQIS
jgi:hypothetical protein